MENDILFKDILKHTKLGTMTAEPQRVTGGYMHKMYKLETTTGMYAVKLLNPAVMKRTDALANYERAERLERLLQEKEIPIVPAMEINGTKMQRAGEQYFYVFPWVMGRALSWKEIKSEHCKIMGTMLAKIHKIQQTDTPFTGEKFCVNWDEYLKRAEADCPEIAPKLQDNRELLYSAQQQYNAALASAPAVTCICDGDMDSKNVLWVDGKPLIIDLECLDYGNPFLEMFQLALSWSGGVINRLDYDCLGAFIGSYRQEYGKVNVDWEALYGIGFQWLDWLEYNVRRAFGIECENEEERNLGISQVHETIQRILYYAEVKEELMNYLEG